MATISNLDRLYSILTEKTGIIRVRDVRLEKIAADRALEMRRHQGLTYNPNNPLFGAHERLQLEARVYPWESIAGVTENLTWHYYPPEWVDPIDAAIDATLPDGTQVGWWNSQVHHDQLMDTRWTHWGHGIHFEEVADGARRWYFVTVFATAMDTLTTRTINLASGKHIGYHLTADGRAIHKAYVTLTSVTGSIIDDRMQVPKLGPMVHMADKPLKGRWIKDDSMIIWSST